MQDRFALLGKRHLLQGHGALRDSLLSGLLARATITQSSCQVASLFGSLSAPHRRFSAGLKCELVTPSDHLLSTIPEIKAADTALAQGKFGTAKQNLSRAKEIVAMIPDPSFKIGVLLRLAKVAQASGHSLEEISTYETVLKILSEHNPMPTSPVSSSEAQPTSAVYVHAKKPTTSTSVNNTASSDTTAPPLEMSSVGYAGELPVFLQWNSIFCSRLVAMLKLGYYQKVVEEVDSHLPSFGKCANWHGVYCLLALRSISLHLQFNVAHMPPITPTTTSSSSTAARAPSSPPSSQQSSTTTGSASSSSSSSSSSSPGPSFPDVVALFESEAKALSTDASYQTIIATGNAAVDKVMRLVQDVLSTQTTSSSSADSVTASVVTPDELGLVIKSYLLSLFVSVARVGGPTVIDSLLHLHSLLISYVPSSSSSSSSGTSTCTSSTVAAAPAPVLARPLLGSWADTVLQQARSLCETIAPVPDFTPSTTTPTTSNTSTTSTPSTTATTPSLTSAPSTAAPIHVSWYGPRIPLLNVLIASPQTSMRTRALKIAERYLPSDSFTLARTLLALAESMQASDPIASEGLFRSALSQLDRGTPTAESIALWIDGTVAYAFLLSKLSWNGKSREPEAVKLLEKAEKVMLEHPGLRPPQRQYTRRVKSEEEVRAELLAEQEAAAKAESAAASKAQAKASGGSGGGLKITSVKANAEALPTISTSSVPADGGGGTSTGTATASNTPPSARPSAPRPLIEWRMARPSPLDFWIVQRYSR